jgi:hypothetical protein
VTRSLQRTSCGCWEPVVDYMASLLGEIALLKNLLLLMFSSILLTAISSVAQAGQELPPGWQELPPGWYYFGKMDQDWADRGPFQNISDCPAAGKANNAPLYDGLPFCVVTPSWDLMEVVEIVGDDKLGSYASEQLCEAGRNDEIVTHHKEHLYCKKQVMTAPIRK